MKKKGFVLMLLMLVAGMLTAPAATKTAQITKQFTKLDVYGGAVVNYNVSNSSKPYMRITGPDDKIANLSFSIKGSTLILGPKKNPNGSCNGNKIRGVVITIYAPMVRDIDASSGARISFMNNINLNSGKIEVDVSSGASVNFTTLNCQKVELDASSGAKISLGNLKANSISLDASSGAGIVCNSLNASYLDCEASSGASLKFGGKARRGEFSASSGGSIRGINFKCDNTSIDKSIGGSIKLK